ncbi:MAG: hypothetical protein IJB31_08240, partial [Akkermansia sp.]|nr:hypothetical protein [Akkermansia sp.]
MKLHLPLGLRRALFAVFALLRPVTAVAVAVAATVQADDLALNKNKTTHTGDTVNVGNIKVDKTGNLDFSSLMKKYNVTATTGDVTSTGTVSTPTLFTGELNITSNAGNVNLNSIQGTRIAVTAAQDINVTGAITMTGGSLTSKGADVNITSSAATLSGTAVVAEKGIVSIANSGTNTLSATNITAIGKNGDGQSVALGGNGALNILISADTEGVGDVLVEGGANLVTGGTTLTSTQGGIEVAGSGNLPASDLLDKVLEGNELLKNFNGNINAVIGKNTKLDAATDVNVHATANLVGDKAQVEADDKVVVDGTINMVNGGANVTADQEVELNGTLNMVNGGANVTATDGKVTLQGSENGNGALGDLISGALGDAAGALGESGMLDNLKGNANVVSGENTKVGAAEVNINGTLNMVGDKAQVEGSDKVVVDGTINMVNGGANVAAGQEVELNGTLNMVNGGANVTATDGKVTLQGSENGNGALGDLIS